jgi:hypothetical protein
LLDARGEGEAHVEPDRQVVLARRVGRREVPEVELARGVVADGKEAGVRLADVEVDEGDPRAVDGELCS